jgi:hypothetical protein
VRITPQRISIHINVPLEKEREIQLTGGCQARVLTDSKRTNREALSAF